MRRKPRQSNERRAPMGVHANEVPRASQGRTSSSTTPVTLRNLGRDDGTLDREWIRQRLGFQLGKFAMKITRVAITFRDENGPAGAPTASATITLHVARLEPIVVHATGATAHLAATQALRATERTLRRHIEKGQRRS